jgi:hypothetical protein
MTPKLTPELSQALAQQRGQPLQVEDPVTHDRYVLLQLDVYEHLQQALDYDASEPDPRAFYPAFADAVKADVDAPGMERYDQDDPPQGPS